MDLHVVLGALRLIALIDFSMSDPLLTLNNKYSPQIRVFHKYTDLSQKLWERITAIAAERDFSDDPANAGKQRTEAGKTNSRVKKSARLSRERFAV